MGGDLQKQAEKDYRSLRTEGSDEAPTDWEEITTNIAMLVLHEVSSRSLTKFEKEFPRLSKYEEDFFETAKEVVSLWNTNQAIAKARSLISQTNNMISVMGSL
jgi:hypothetical protein